MLLADGAKLNIYDPKAEKEQIIDDLSNLSISENPEKGFQYLIVDFVIHHNS